VVGWGERELERRKVQLIFAGLHTSVYSERVDFKRTAPQMQTYM